MPPLDYAEPFDIAAETSSSIIGQLPAFTLATVADIGTSLWNSLPFTPEVKTEDMLAKVSNDALAVYNEHPDAVATASLLAGSLVPGGIAMKLLGRARSGVTALGYTTNEVGSSLIGQARGAITGGRQLALQSEIEASFRVSGEATAEYKKLSRQLLIANATQQVADNAVIELAVVGALNAHPYMEDYLKDPGTNFAISVGVGGILGSLFAIPITNQAIFKATGEVAVRNVQEILESGYRTANYSDMTNTAQYQRSSMNIRTLQSLIDESVPGNVGADPIRAQIVNTLMLKESASREESIIRMFPQYERSDPELKGVINQLISRPDMVGVDKIKWIDLNRIDKDTAKVVAISTGDKQWNPIVKEILDKFGTKDKAKLGMVLENEGFDPATIAEVMGESLKLPKTFVDELGKPVVAFARLGDGGQLEVFASSGARNAAHAVDIKDSAVYVTGSKAEKVAFAQIVKDFGEENVLRSVSAAETDMRFLKELNSLNKLKPEQLPYIAVAPDDLARQNAIVSLLSKLSQEDLALTKVKVTSQYPTYEAAQSYLTKTVGKDYSNKLSNLAQDYDKGLYRNSSRIAQELLLGWQGSDQGTLRRAFDAFFRGTSLPPNERGNVETARNIWQAGIKYREELKKIADADGNVYLYRKIHGTVKGHAPVEGYSVGPGDFTREGVRLFKVNVDNVIGSINSGHFQGEREILVSSPHHEIVNNIPTETTANTSVSLATSEAKTEITAESFLKLYGDETERQVRDMLSAGMSLEEISARTNSKTEVLRYVASGGHLNDYPNEWRRYSDATKMDDYLSPKGKLFAIVGNPIKNPTGDAINKLDNRLGSIAHMEQVEQLTVNSGSSIANTVLDVYTGREMRAVINDLQNSLAEINNVLVGDPRWQSADNALRKLASGPTITYLGKQIIDRTDALKRTFIEPIATALLPLKDKPEALIELNAAFNKLASLTGWRDVRRIEGFDQAVIVQRELGLTAEGKQGLIEKTVKNADGSEFVIQQGSVIDFLESTRTLKDELYRTHNLNRAMTGRAPLSDIGFWVPPINLVNKSFAFVIDPTGMQNVRLLTATKADELESLITAFSKAHPNEFNIVRKGEQAEYNMLKGYTDYEAFTTYANVAFKHKGASALAIVPTDTRMIDNIMQGYENLILQSARKYTETYMADTMQWLDNMSSFYRRGVEAQPKEKVAEEYIKNSALTVKNILLGRDQLEQSPTLRKINTLTDVSINYATQAIDRVINTTNIDQVGTKAYYDKLNAKLKQVGVNQPLLGSFQEYLAAATPQSKDISHAAISAGNGLMATLMLRMMELAQPIVNVMSLPILTSSALMERLPKTVINAQGDSMVFPLRQMMDGMRSMFNPQHIAIEKNFWEPQGLVNQTVRQYTEVLGIIHQAPLGKTFSQKAVDTINGFQNSAIIKDFLAKPADWAENFTRSYAMHTGYDAAKRAYPGISDSGATIMAVNFSDRAIGNYHAAQRPSLFQGSFGAGLGLFQTYFLTFAQSIYRGMEERNFKQLASLMLAQTGLFGIGSWPGYNLLSEQIVSNFSDKHYDMTTGLFRAVGNGAAEVALYGLPSSLGPAFYTRGDISPRVPSTMTELAVLNGVKEGFSAIHKIVKGVATGIPNGTGVQSLFEALSLQSLNRPIARWSELVTGNSITQQGNTVSPTSEVWTPMGVTARLLATRPIEEQVTRNAVHLNQVYESQDHDRRQAVMNKLKVAVRAGNLGDEVLGTVAGEYLRRGGSAKGWQSAINQVLIESPEGVRMDLLRKLEPNSPLNKMIKDLY